VPGLAVFDSTMYGLVVSVATVAGRQIATGRALGPPLQPHQSFCAVVLAPLLPWLYKPAPPFVAEFPVNPAEADVRSPRVHINRTAPGAPWAGRGISREGRVVDVQRARC